MIIASFASKAWCLVVLSAAMAMALGRLDKALEAKEATWLARQPTATQRVLRARGSGWKRCSAQFDRRSAASEAAAAATLGSPTLYRITTGGVVVSSTAPGLCPSNIQVAPGDARLAELDAWGSNPDDGMIMWDGAREACFTAATRFAERFNRDLAR